jgi:hypothetical protein
MVVVKGVMQKKLQAGDPVDAGVFNTDLRM